MSLSSSSLFSDLDVEVIPDAPLGAMTWYGIGGRADLLVRPRTVVALETLARRCARSGTPLRVLGNGANLLVADEGVDGIVVRLDQPVFREVRYNQTGEIQLMRAMAGADLAKTLMETVRRGMDGLVPLAGIPASIGGAIRMNAGGAYGAIAEAVDSVTCISRNGRRVTYPASELVFDYRSTNIPDPIILAAVFRLVPDDPVRVRARVKEIFEYKKSTQPLADHSAGCAFKNPFDPVQEERRSAGRLIDEAGLKGLRIGGATISRHHANFIVAEPGASASDVEQLLAEVRRRVFERSGLELEEEVVIWRRGDPS
ncbi:MAG: UDP-N-acetylmuramate dehydrogenase [Phycisphaerales bacterium]|nr:UDP-N-acetylmuramate dehydrogenase [Phycisphaerales bacterium]NNM25321.1 UDP-N-acetylmuramate dehydrogenase [Phycisphaerales bacterium]